jgi:hypothetical protein
MSQNSADRMDIMYFEGLACANCQYLWHKFYANPHYSTFVESIRQISLFMQNKANFRKSQMDIKLIITRDYEKNLHWTLGENKAKQSQIEGMRIGMLNIAA